MKRLVNILIVFFSLLFVYIAVSGKLEYSCIIKSLTGIRCPACGLTRGFISILHLDFIKSFQCNILSIPIFISFIILFIMLIYDIIFNKFNTINFVNKCFSKYYIFIILIVFISMIVNNIRGI